MSVIERPTERNMTRLPCSAGTLAAGQQERANQRAPARHFGGGIVATNTRSRTTAADIAAAVKLGTMAADAVVMTAADAAADAADADANRPALSAADMVERAERSASAHDCGMPGCRHGSAHPAVSQPDRQVKLQCPGCGAVARMTASALAKSAGILCAAQDHSGTYFVPAQRRTYTRKAV